MLEKLQESVLDNIDKNDGRLTPVINVQDEDYPEYMFIIENTAVGDSPLKKGVPSDLLEHTLAAFDVRFKIWYLDRFEYEGIQEIDHCMDWKFNQKDYMTCILFDYPDTVREQVKFIIQMMSVYWGSFWGYSDVLMYKFDGNIYLPMEDRTSELVAAAHDIAGLAFWLTHSDAKRSFQYEGEELKKLKHKICAMLPDNSSYGYQQVSKIIDLMLRVRKRRLKKYKHCGDADGSNIKWRPIVTESVLDNIGEISTDSAEQLAAEQTSGNPLDYQFLYVIAIKTDVFDIQNIRIVCEMFRLECMLRIYGRQELHEQKYIDWTKWSHLPGNENFLCLYIDKLPDTMTQRVQFMLKLFTIVLLELNESTSAFRFDKIDDIFKMKTQGHMTKSWYMGYFGLWSEDRKSYDDTLFTSQFATLVNTTNHTIYNECDAELRKIRDRILAKKSAKRLDESILDDVTHSDTKLSNINSDVRPDDKSLMNYKYMFGFCATGQHNVEPITERICEIMGVDVRVVQWTLSEFRQKRDIIDQSHNTDYETEFLVCVFFNRPESIYKRVKFMIRMMSSLIHDYDMLTDVCKYINHNGDKFIYDKYKVNTVSYAFRLDGVLLKLKYGISLDKDGVEETKTRFRGQFIQLMFDDVALDDYQYNEPVDEILDKMIQRATHGNSSLLESVLDDLEGSDIESTKVLAKEKLPALDYDEMYLFNAVPKETDSAKPLILVKDLAVAMGIDMCVELWHTNEMSYLDYIDNAYDEYFQTDFQVCVYIRRPKSDYLKAKFFLMLMQIISNGYETGTDIYVYINKHGNFFKARTWQGGTMLKLDMAIKQEKLNAKYNQTIDIMSYGPTINVYQDVCDILEFETPERKLAVERALKNLLKQVRMSVTSGLNESVLDDLEHSDMKRDELVQTTMPDELYYEYMFMFEIKTDSSYDPEMIYDMAAAMGVEVRVNEYDYIEDDYANIDYIDHFQDDAHRTNHFLAVFVNLPASDYRKALFIIQLLRTVSWIYTYLTEPTVWTYKRINGKFDYLCWTAKTLTYITSAFELRTYPDDDTVINLRTDVAYIIKHTNGDISPMDKVVKALDYILLSHSKRFEKSTKLQESILDDVGQTSSLSADRLKDLPASVDTNIERFERFPRAFLFHYANRKRYNLEIVLNTMGIDYELLDVDRNGFDNIDWISTSRNSDKCLLLFVELPKTIFERTKLFMKILSAVLSDYALLIDLIDIYHRETESDETKFINRGSASAVIGTSSDLNNYFNGGSVYNNKSAQTIDKFISVWKKQFTNLIDYGMNWTSAFNKLDMTIGKLDRRRQKLLNVKRNYLEKTSV